MDETRPPRRLHGVGTPASDVDDDDSQMFDLEFGEIAETAHLGAITFAVWIVGMILLAASPAIVIGIWRWAL